MRLKRKKNENRREIERKTYQRRSANQSLVLICSAVLGVLLQSTRLNRSLSPLGSLGGEENDAISFNNLEKLSIAELRYYFFYKKLAKSGIAERLYYFVIIKNSKI